MGRVKKSGLIYASLKAGQQILNDLNKVVKNDSVVDVIRFMTESYVCKLGAVAAAAYTIDKAISYVEECLPKKYLKGIVPLVLTTAGTAAAVYYGGEYMNITPGENFVETATQLFHNCQQSLVDLVNLNPNIKEGYLINTAIFGMAGIRWGRNICEAIGECAEEKRLEARIEKQKRQENLEKSLNGMVKNGRGQ